MNEEHISTEVYLSNLSKTPHNEEGKKKIRDILARKFTENLQESIERIWDLPNLNISNPSEPYGDLLIEARDLYINGYFYSCVAMCGIVGERLIKDVLRKHVIIEKGGEKISPNAEAFDHLERVEIRGIVQFLKATELLSKDAVKAATDLIELRNTYSHARGKRPDEDAIRAIKCLHKIVDDTVSVFKGFDLKNDVMMLKDIEIRDDGMKAKRILHKPSGDH
jgi:hypothetical protein